MAISPKICITYESNATAIYVEDETGIYDVATNTGGYGTPNGDRADYAAVLYVYYQPYEGDASTLTDPDVTGSAYVDYSAGYANTQVSKFTLDYYKDGYYTFVYTLVPTSVGSPAEGTIIYSTANGDLRQYDSGLSLVPVYDLSYLESSTLYEVVIVEELGNVKLRNKYGDLDLEYFECDQCEECGCDEEWAELIYLRQGLESAKRRFYVAKLEAQRMIEKLTKKYKTES